MKCFKTLLILTILFSIAATVYADQNVVLEIKEHIFIQVVILQQLSKEIEEVLLHATSVGLKQEAIHPNSH